MLKKKITSHSGQLSPSRGQMGAKLHWKAAGSTWGQAFPLLDQKAFFDKTMSGHHYLRSISFGRHKTNRKMPAGFSTLIKSPRVTGLVSGMIPMRAGVSGDKS